MISWSEFWAQIESIWKATHRNLNADEYGIRLGITSENIHVHFVGSCFQGVLDLENDVWIAELKSVAL